MKLFQQMLVATASLSLITPIAAQASDTVNIEEIGGYVRSTKKRSSRLDSNTFINKVNEDIANLKGSDEGLEVKQNLFEAGGFSDTTTLDGKAVFALAAADHTGTYTSNTEALQFQYMYQMNLNSTFTGDDNLYVRLKTGNASGWTGVEEQGGYLVSAKGNSDAIKVDKIWYTFPVGDSNTIWIGPEIENYYMHATTPSIYSPTMKQFTLGGNASAYGASTNSGFGWAYNADNGFAVSSNVVSKQTNSVMGLFTKEAQTSWATQVGYTQPQYSISAMVNLKYNGWADSYFGTTNGIARPDRANSTNIGLRAWWRPEETGTATPAVSVGYDSSDVDTPAGKTTDMFFVGLNWADMFTPDDKIGLAFGQPQTREDETVDPFSYEAYYQYTINDATTLRTTVFGNSDRDGTAGHDNNGLVLETTFKF